MLLILLFTLALAGCVGLAGVLRLASFCGVTESCSASSGAQNPTGGIVLLVVAGLFLAGGVTLAWVTARDRWEDETTAGQDASEAQPTGTVPASTSETNSPSSEGLPPERDPYEPRR